jgi:hypothetical protein
MRTATTLCALLVIAAPAAAQTSRTDPTDVQVWYAAGLGIDLPQRWSAELKYRLRMVDDAQDYRGSYITAEVGRKVSDNLTLFGGYRLALVDVGTFHRFAAGVEGEAKLGKVTVSLRPGVQYQHKQFADDTEGSETATLLPTRLKAKLPLSALFGVYASTEPYFNPGDGYFIDNWRNTVGLTVKYGSGRKLDIFYIYRPDYAKSYNRTFHVIGIDLDFDIKPFGKSGGGS